MARVDLLAAADPGGVGLSLVEAGESGWIEINATDHETDHNAIAPIEGDADGGRDRRIPRHPSQPV